MQIEASGLIVSLLAFLALWYAWYICRDIGTWKGDILFISTAFVCGIAIGLNPAFSF